MQKPNGNFSRDRAFALLVIAFATLLAGAWSASLSAGPSAPTTSPAPARSSSTQADGYQLVWSDEFNTNGPLSDKDWNYERGFVRNEELQWYQPDNAVCKDGCLIIEARREHKPNPRYVPSSRAWQTTRPAIEYTSASVNTNRKHTFQYGRFEIRARINTQPGSWPAFWTLGVRGAWPANGEIDVMEYYDNVLLANFSWLGDGGNGHSGSFWNDTRLPIRRLGEGWSDKFHVWRMDWDESSIKLYCDDRLLNSQDLTKVVNTPRAVAAGALSNPFHQPVYLLLNQAIGGERGGDPSRTEFPIRYEIDYVRVYQTPSQMRAATRPAPAAASTAPTTRTALDIVTEAAQQDRPATGRTKADYLALIQADVDYFKQFQQPGGAIFDPVINKEVQYSTPSFAAAAALLVLESKRNDLLDPASRALTCSINALVSRKTADGHADFYIPLIMQAYDRLKGHVAAAAQADWEKQLRAVDPHTMYRADLRMMNWNIVSTTGEALRRKAGLVPDDLRDDQWKYIEESFAGHSDHLTALGMYEDPSGPLAYDAFSRYWLETMLSSGAYDGKLTMQFRTFLRTGGLNSLLLLSPTGEWASGGRSAFHQWNEAELSAICEMEANRWKRFGRDDVAGAFKRAAHLALASMQRWQRPGGELWIVKNHADPAQRIGFETYSQQSQYNLLPMAMLATAYTYADDTIAERPTPAEAGGYVLDLREPFHKIVVAAGGYYVLIDTAADPHYNATGLQRVQRAGVPFSPLSDSTAADRAYGPAKPAKLALSPGVCWKTASGQWLSLASFTHSEPNAQFIVKQADLTVREASSQRAAFAIDYSLEHAGAAWHVGEDYVITAQSVETTARVSGDVTALRWQAPALVSDGAADTHIVTDRGQASIEHAKCTLRLKLLSAMSAVTPRLGDEKTVSHQGYVQPLIADAPSGTTSIQWQWSLTGQP